MDGSSEAPVTTRLEADGLAQWLLDSLLSVSIPAAAQGSAALEGLRAGALRAAARITELAGGVLDTLTDDPLVKAGKGKVERMAAEWRWSGRGLGPQVRLPLNTEIDERLMVTCALAALEFLASCRTVDISGESQFSFFLPPATMSLTLAALGIFYKPGGVLLHEVCLSPFCVVEKKQYARLFLSSLVHVDAAHLLQNLSVMVPECAELERQVGPPRMAMELVVLTALSHGLYVAWALFEKKALSRPAAYYSVGAVGLSSLALAVQVTCRASSADSAQLMFFPVIIPKKYMWAVHVLLSHVSAPDASLAGHMCGVVAGLLHGYIIAPGLGALARLVRGQGQGQGQGRVPNWGSGTWGAAGTAGSSGAGGVGGQRAAGPGGSGRGGAAARRPWWRHRVWQHLKELGLQVAVAALVLGVCTVSNSKRPNRRPIDLWPMTSK